MLLVCDCRAVVNLSAKIYKIKLTQKVYLNIPNTTVIVYLGKILFVLRQKGF